MVEYNVIAGIYTFIADIQPRGRRNQELNLIFISSAERAAALNADASASCVLSHLFQPFKSDNLRAALNDLVDETVLARLFRSHKVVSLGVMGNNVNGLAGILCENIV